MQCTAFIGFKFVVMIYLLGRFSFLNISTRLNEVTEKLEIRIQSESCPIYL